MDFFGKEQNDLLLEWRRKTSNGEWSDWEELEAGISAIYYNAEVGFSGDYREVYYFQAHAKDKLNDIYTPETAVQALPVFDWSGSDFNFNVPVNFS